MPAAIRTPTPNTAPSANHTPRLELGRATGGGGRPPPASLEQSGARSGAWEWQHARVSEQECAASARSECAPCAEDRQVLSRQTALAWCHRRSARSGQGLTSMVLSAARNASAVWKRLAGSLAMAIMMIWFSPAGRSQRSVIGSGGSLIQVRGHQRVLRIALEGQLAGKQFVQRNTEGINVGARIRRFSAHLFRRHIVQRAKRSAGGCQRPSVAERAMPKSMSFTTPCGVSIMLAGLMSRWMMLCLCA